MKMNCAVAGDLMPLYLENLCSEETRAALEEHLRECPECREKLARMEKGGDPPAGAREDSLPIADYAKKVKRRRLRVGVAASLMGMLAVCALSLVGLTVMDMRREANPILYETGEGVYNLSAGELETTAEEVGQYVFYTNYAKIKVTVSGAGAFHGAVMLWNIENSDSFIRISEVDEDASSCAFAGLSSQWRYRITCDGLSDVKITVSDGRDVTFGGSLKRVLGEIFG